MDFSSKLVSTIAFLMICSACVDAPSTRANKNAMVGDQAPIENPFQSFTAPKGNESTNITLRTRHGDDVTEVEVPQDQNSEFTVPYNTGAKRGKPGSEAAIGQTADNGVDYQYMKTKATSADREIASTFNHTDDGANDAKKREIESSLGLQESDEPLNLDESYLAKVDIIKQLFHEGRFEAALIETDRMVKMYPTDGKLYEMRGTLLDRLGYPDLALRSWKQALEFEPKKLALKKMIEKREVQRNVASQK